MAMRQRYKDRHVVEAVAVEPELNRILDKAQFSTNEGEDFDHARLYSELRTEAARYVGFGADNPRIRTREHYDAIVNLIDNLLSDHDADSDRRNTPELYE
jgi:hypothetical protein